MAVAVGESGRSENVLEKSNTDVQSSIRFLFVACNSWSKILSSDRKNF